MVQSPRKHTAGLQKRGLSLNWLGNGLNLIVPKSLKRTKVTFQVWSQCPSKRVKNETNFKVHCHLSFFLLIEAFKNYYWPLSDHCTSTITADTSKKRGQKIKQGKNWKWQTCHFKSIFPWMKYSHSKRGKRRGDNTSSVFTLFFSVVKCKKHLLFVDFCNGWDLGQVFLWVCNKECFKCTQRFLLLIFLLICEKGGQSFPLINVHLIKASNFA